MRDITICLRLDSIQPIGTPRYVITVDSQRSKYQVYVSEIEPILDVLADLFPRITPKTVKLQLQVAQSEWWKFTDSVEEEVEEALINSLPPQSRHVRFKYRVLSSSGDFQLICIPYGTIPAPEIPSMPHYSTLPELIAKLKVIRVSFPSDVWDTGLGFFVRADALKALGFDISRL